MKIFRDESVKNYFEFHVKNNKQKHILNSCASLKIYPEVVSPHF